MAHTTDLRARIGRPTASARQPRKALFCWTLLLHGHTHIRVLRDPVISSFSINQKIHLIALTKILKIMHDINENIVPACKILMINSLRFELYKNDKCTYLIIVNNM